MKKFYSLLAAAFAGTMMVSAAMPANVTRNAEKSFSLVSAEKSTAKKALNLKSTDIIIADENDELPDMTGHYFFTGTLNDVTGNYGIDLERVNGVNYLVKHLIFSDALDIPATFQYQQLELQDGTYNVPILKILGNGVTPFFTLSGKNYNLYLGSLIGNDFSVYRDDIEFFLTNDGTLMLLYDNTGIAWLNSDNRGNCLMNPSELTPANGTFATVEQGEEGGAQNGAVLAVAYEEGNEAALSLRNLFDLDDYSLEFVLDKDNNTLHGEGDGLKIVELTTDEGATWIPFNLGTYQLEGQQLYISSTVDATFEVFDLGNEKFQTVITFPAEGLAIYNDQAGYWRIFDNTTVTLDFALPSNKPAGIDNVIADEDANAPVEYFNLQGIRVENPAAGIYVRRQGSKVSKVLVK